MAGWLLLPVIECSWGAWNDTPISEGDVNAPRADPGQTDNARLHEGEGFFGKLGTGIKKCYAKTPFFAQEEWKTNLLYTFAGVSVLAFLIGRIVARRNRSYTP
jgi:hypothetical protein